MREAGPAGVVPSRRRSGLCGVVTVVLSLMPGHPLYAQNIEGRVVRADSTPVAGAFVELHRITESSGSVQDSTLSNSSGRFHFTLDGGEDREVVFVPSARHAGVLYWGTPIHGREDAAHIESQLLVVFDTAAVASPVSDLRVTLRHVVLTPLVSGVQVEEVIDVAGRERRTLVAADDSSFVWIAPLASDAHGILVAQGGVSPDDVHIADGQVAFRGVLPPPGIRVAISYFIPANRYELELRHPTRRLDVLVVDKTGLVVEATGLARAPVGDDVEMRLHRFTGSDLAPGSRVSVRAALGERHRGAPWLWLVLGVVLALGAIVSAAVGRRTRT